MSLLISIIHVSLYKLTSVHYNDRVEDTRFFYFYKLTSKFHEITCISCFQFYVPPNTYLFKHEK